MGTKKESSDYRVIHDHTFQIILIVTLIFVVAVVIVYCCNWGSSFISKEKEDWVFFTEYFNNLLSPVLLFISIVTSVYLIVKQMTLSQLEARKLALRETYLQTSDQIDRLLEEEVFVLSVENNNVPEPFLLKDTLQISDADYLYKKKIAKDKNETVPFNINIRIDLLIRYLVRLSRLATDYKIINGDGGFIDMCNSHEYVIACLADPINWPNKYVRLNKERLEMLRSLISDQHLLNKLDSFVESLNSSKGQKT